MLSAARTADGRLTRWRPALIAAWALPHILIAGQLTPDAGLERFVVTLQALNLLPLAGVPLMDLFGWRTAAIGWLAGICVGAWGALLLGFVFPQGDQASLIYVTLPWSSAVTFGPLGVFVSLGIRWARRR